MIYNIQDLIEIEEIVELSGFAIGRIIGYLILAGLLP